MKKPGQACDLLRSRSDARGQSAAVGPPAAIRISSLNPKSKMQNGIADLTR